MLLILKTIKIFKNFKKVLLIHRGYVAAYIYIACNAYYVGTWFGLQITSPDSTHYRHTKHMLPHYHDGLIILFKIFKYFKFFNICNINKEINK